MTNHVPSPDNSSHATADAHAEDSGYHHKPETFGDHMALRVVKFMRFFADAFFAKRYGHRAVVLETVAGVPGMVGGMALHLKSLRSMRDDEGWIRTLLDEAENERMHLMAFIEIAQPTRLERGLVVTAQGLFFLAYLLVYTASSKTAHRIVGYLEEEAVVSYTEYLKRIESGEVENVPAPSVAIKHWNLPEDATLHTLVTVIRADESTHREVNHCLANKIAGKECDIHPSPDMNDAAREKLDSFRQRSAP